MISVQEILDDINLRYRNTFTTEQKLFWINQEQVELFDVLGIDSEPYFFKTVENANFYPLPEGFDVTKIKTVSMQMNSSSPHPSYKEIPFLRNDDNVGAQFGVWYTLVSDAMYIHYSGGVPGDMGVYIYCDADPEKVTLENLDDPPSLPSKYIEILELGVLKRIAEARKDVLMHNNYDQSYQEKIADVMWDSKLKEPEFVQPTSSQRKRGRSFVVNGW